MTERFTRSRRSLNELVCRLLGHRWAWCTVEWNTGRKTEEDRCLRCGHSLTAIEASA